MAVWEVRDREIDALIEQWLRSKIEHGAIMARYNAADADKWCLPEYQAETDLIDYHRFIAERLYYYAGRDVSSSERALAVVRQIALASSAFIRRYGWGYPQLDAFAKQALDSHSDNGRVRDPRSWWERNLNA